MIDLRSDTVTKPSPAMLDAMMSAEVGDDVFGEDPTVLALERKAADLLGAEEGIFCPSGTMTNQIGINVLSNPYEEIICYQGAHVYRYEGGGVAGTSGLSFRLLEGNRGRLSAREIEENINPEDIYYPKTSVIELENTINKSGGCYYTLKEIKSIYVLAQQHGLKMHLDGARLFNALAETGENPEDYGQYFDTISICLSKGLGAPVGSLLVGGKKWITKARRVRKFMGGGMRQGGYMAAAGLYALENNIDRLKEDHSRARTLGKALTRCDFIKTVNPVDTNIVIGQLNEGVKMADILTQLKKKGLLAVPMSANEIRLVTHLDFDDKQLEQAVNILTEFS